MEKESEKGNKFLYILLGGCVLAIASSFYLFYYKKDFNFIVETNCNQDEEICFYRDCTNPDDCPPNGFSYYNEYTIRATDFKYCPNEDCTEVCKTRAIDCLKTECTDIDIENGVCVVPLNQKID